MGVVSRRQSGLGFENQEQGLKTPLITRQGYEDLRKELDELWRVERPDITKKVTWAASLGDRSENADPKL